MIEKRKNRPGDKWIRERRARYRKTAEYRRAVEGGKRYELSLLEAKKKTKKRKKTTKNPSPAQIAARKAFAERARSGAFKRKARSSRKAISQKQRVGKPPSPAQLAARAKFVAMVRAKAKKKNPLFGFGRVKKRGRKKVKKGLFGLAKKTRRVSYSGSKGAGFLGVTARTQWGLKRKKRRATKKLKSLFNPAQRAALRKVACRYNPGKIRFTEAELARYAPKIKGLSSIGSAPRSSGRSVLSSGPKKRKKKFKRAGVFSGSGFLGLGRSKQTIRANKRNPSPASVFSEFRGKNVRSKSKSVGHGSGHLTVAQLGQLRELKLTGKKLSFGGKALLCADGRKKLHIAGVKLKVRGNPGGEVDMGEVHSVTYRSDKPHIETGTFDYVHKFGEDGGKRPHLIVDAEGYPFFEGGSYRIDADGIIN